MEMTPIVAKQVRIPNVGRLVILKLDNVRDHPAGMSDSPLQKHTQVRLGVHHIVIGRLANIRYSIGLNVANCHF